MKEIWKTIADHPNYQVSNFGRVRSKSRWLVNRNGIKRWWPRRLLYIHGDKGSYRSLTLDECGLFVHILVAKAFIPNPLGKETVNHKDFNRSNNRVGNLEWATRKEQMLHAKANGRLLHVIEKRERTIAKKPNNDPLPCIICSVLVEQGNRGKRRHFCSWRCRQISYRKPAKCHFCGGIFNASGEQLLRKRRGISIYCSPSCRGKGIGKELSRRHKTSN